VLEGLPVAALATHALLRALHSEMGTFETDVELRIDGVPCIAT